MIVSVSLFVSVLTRVNRAKPHEYYVLTVFNIVANLIREMFRCTFKIPWNDVPQSKINNN